MVLITGATGFIGKRLSELLERQGVPCRLLARQQTPGTAVIAADLGNSSALQAACHGVETIFHCAGYAHAFASSAEDARLHWQINYEGTRNLLDAAVSQGVKRFVFISTVKAMAEPGEACVNEDHPGEPETDYGRAKRAAERLVLATGSQYGMHVVNLRLAMVYGAGGNGNLERMARLVRRGLFPPLPETGNRRSLVHVTDVLSAMQLVSRDPRANGRTYTIVGPESPSGRQLMNEIRHVVGRPEPAWSVPMPVLKLAAGIGDLWKRLLGRRFIFDTEVLSRLVGSACYSGERIRAELGWQPSTMVREGLREMLRGE